MSGVPYTFASATSSIPLSQLDANFATNATLGNATVGLGNTTTTVGNLTVSNVTINGLSGGSANGVVYINTSNVATANASVFALDGNGNLGLGVTPSAWNSSAKAFDVGSVGAFWSYGTATMAMSSNAYLNSSTSYTYKQSAYAGQYEIRSDTGAHYWKIAPSGTAGNAITFTQAMILDNSGKWYLNNTSGVNGYQMSLYANCLNVGGFGIQDTNTIYGGGVNYLLFNNSSGTLAGAIQHSGSTSVLLVTSSDKRLKTDDGVVTDVSYLDKTVIHNFTWTECGTKDRGIFAQDEYENNPRLVQQGSDELTENGKLKTPWTVNYTGYIPDLIVYCQQLKKQVTELSAQVTTLQSQVAALKA